MLSSEELAKYEELKEKEKLSRKEKILLKKLEVEVCKNKIHDLRRRIEVFQRDLNNPEAHQLNCVLPSSSLAKEFFSKLPPEELSIAQAYLRLNPTLCLEEAQQELKELKMHMFALQHPILRKVGEILDELTSGEQLLKDEDKIDDINSLSIDV